MQGRINRVDCAGTNAVWNECATNFQFVAEVRQAKACRTLRPAAFSLKQEQTGVINVPNGKSNVSCGVFGPGSSFARATL